MISPSYEDSVIMVNNAQNSPPVLFYGAEEILIFCLIYTWVWFHIELVCYVTS